MTKKRPAPVPPVAAPAAPILPQSGGAYELSGGVLAPAAPAIETPVEAPVEAPVKED